MDDTNPFPPEISFTTGNGYPHFQATFPANNYVPGYPYTHIPTSYPCYVTIEPPLTEEKVRLILREELARYFDEGKDILAPAAKIITVCAFCQKEVPVRFEIQDAQKVNASWHRCCDPCLETMNPSHLFVRPLS